MPVKKALIMVDLQNDFCAGGRLAVPDGDAVIPLANQLAPLFDLVVATQDWHPCDHKSFASQHVGRRPGEVIRLGDIEQVLWPDHCVQHSQGAQFHPILQRDFIHQVIQKGTDSSIDSYSAFYDNAHLRATGLDAYLKKQNVRDIYLLGLATDYCVKFSALDAVQLGYHVHVIVDACRGIELHQGDIQKSLDEMQRAGVHLIQSNDLLGSTK